jgi:hypothetical protein
MKRTPTLVKTCSKCGVKLTDFIGYIPHKGEACMKCYTEYAQGKELKPKVA